MANTQDTPLLIIGLALVVITLTIKNNQDNPRYNTLHHRVLQVHRLLKRGILHRRVQDIRSVSIERVKNSVGVATSMAQVPNPGVVSRGRQWH